MFILGHRGAPRVATENTLAAFAAARTAGADGVEVDVRWSADRQLVMSHDAHLADGTVVRDHDRSALPAAMPTLAETLDECAGLFVNIEIKNIPYDPDFDEDLEIASAVVALLRERRAAGVTDRVLVSSFHPPTLGRVRVADPDVPVGLLKVAVSDATAMAAKAVESGFVAVNPERSQVTEDLIATVRGAGLEVHVWTVNDVEEARRFRDWGATSIITDDPATMVEELGEQSRRRTGLE